MASLQLTTGVLGLGLALTIVYLLRRDHIHVMSALFWSVVALLAVVLGLWPGSIDRLSAGLGISYPPAGLLLAAICVLLLKALHADMRQTHLERELRQLNQRMALYEMASQGDAPASAGPTLTPDRTESAA
ncbi:MAG: hypothetical protein OHK0048_23030 [Rhodoferax sp.]